MPKFAKNDVVKVVLVKHFTGRLACIKNVKELGEGDVAYIVTVEGYKETLLAMSYQLAPVKPKVRTWKDIEVQTGYRPRGLTI